MTISTIGNNGLGLTSPLPVLQGGTGVTTSAGLTVDELRSLLGIK